MQSYDFSTIKTFQSQLPLRSIRSAVRPVSAQPHRECHRVSAHCDWPDRGRLESGRLRQLHGPTQRDVRLDSDSYGYGFGGYGYSRAGMATGMRPLSAPSRHRRGSWKSSAARSSSTSQTHRARSSSGVARRRIHRVRRSRRTGERRESDRSNGEAGAEIARRVAADPPSGGGEP